MVPNCLQEKAFLPYHVCTSDILMTLLARFSVLYYIFWLMGYHLVVYLCPITTAVWNTHNGTVCHN